MNSKLAVTGRELLEDVNNQRSEAMFRFTKDVHLISENGEGIMTNSQLC